MMPTWRAIVALTMIWSAVGPVAPAAHAQDGWQAAEPRLDDAELSCQRGGFTVAGLDIQLGAEIRSYLGDQLVMQTNISWTAVGGNVATTYAAGLTPTTADTVRTGLLAGTGVRFDSGGETVLLANQGQTAFIQHSTGSIQNVVINGANNVRVNQIIDAKFDISGYSLFRNSILATRISWVLAATGAPGSLPSRPY